MDSGISTVRNLLFIVIVLVLLATASTFYLGSQLARNSDELKRLGELMQQQLMTSATEQSRDIQLKLDQLHGDANAMDKKMDDAGDRLIHKLDDKAPDIFGRAMDKYVQRRVRSTRSKP